jgi:hypothetical protein
VSKAYFALLDTLCHHHTGTIAQQNDQTVAFILTSLDQVGLGPMHAGRPELNGA